jgi:hypothetical protein
MIMNFIKNIALSALLTIGAFGAVMYTSCNKDECKDVTCLNGGTCSGGNCVCLAGYEGVSCETLSATKFVGTWNVSEPSCGGNYPTTIGVGTTPTTISFSNLGNFTNPAQVIASVDKNSIIISNFTDATGRKFSGNGTFSSNSISVTYTVTYTDNTSETCTATFSK